ncbi:MAG: alkaline phosphatase family protein [Chloroherpetonaceae bacterium]|nr:alkaline phosphatase family protein [Chloroherpetonaceae bacterium]MDW8437675.1 alkaline phosphatase D family protein [Chloroherpetonaceae bacterium]
MKRVVPLILFLLHSAALMAQADLLQSGPMLGYSEMKEVLLWVQTKAQARVKFEYWEKGKPETRASTDEVLTNKQTAFVAKLVADKVEPGRRYEYALYINGQKVDRPYPLEFQTQPLWQWRTDPPEFTIALGSCYYRNEERYDRPGRGYGSDYEIFSAIHAKRPDLMLWLGDNIYLREPDWNAREGIFHRHAHQRALPELQPLLASTHHYAIWDDHDYGPNDHDRSFWNKEQTLEAFKLFWGNPAYGVAGLNGITGQAQWGDVELFLLDNRYNRSPNDRKTETRTILGEAQFRWLIDALVSSKATFKIVAIGGQVLNSVARYETYQNVAPEEKARLIKAITDEGVKGVVFVDGDRHHTELSKLDRAGTYPLYDLTVSPLTSGVNVNAAKEENAYRVPDTIVTERNFAILKFSGPLKDRAMTITIYNKDGNALWSRTIKASELQ